MLLARRIKMDDQWNRQDRLFVLFDEGNISHPVRCITDFEAKALAESILEQLKEPYGK